MPRAKLQPEGKDPSQSPRLGLLISGRRSEFGVGGLVKDTDVQTTESEPQGELSTWNLHKAPGDSDTQTGSQQSGQPSTPAPTRETPCTSSLRCLYGPMPWPDTPPRPSSSSPDCSLLGSPATPTPRVAVPLSSFQRTLLPPGYPPMLTASGLRRPGFQYPLCQYLAARPPAALVTLPGSLCPLG